MRFVVLVARSTYAYFRMKVASDDEPVTVDIDDSGFQPVNAVVSALLCLAGDSALIIVL